MKEKKRNCGNLAAKVGPLKKITKNNNKKHPKLLLTELFQTVKDVEKTCLFNLGGETEKGDNMVENCM